MGPGMRPTRRHLQRGIIVLPSAFTLGNLFLGFWAMVSASRGQFDTAAWLIVIAAAVDMVDGRIARFTSTGSEFGEQIDSLVDALAGATIALVTHAELIRAVACHADGFSLDEWHRIEIAPASVSRLSVIDGSMCFAVPERSLD